MLSQRLFASKGPSRSYKDAIKRLNDLQTGFEALSENRRLGRRSNKNGVEEMKILLERVGYSVADLERLKIIHVAGTKGKGGTCAFIDSILRAYRKKHGYPSKVGLFTSPHLKHVRERIQINSEPISEDCFARYFFRSWDQIAPGDAINPEDRPGYFRFLTLMSFDIFLEEGVTVAIYETGVGGENDATNVIGRPIVTGITKLGSDHGKTLKVPPHLRPSYFTLERDENQESRASLEEIAWHKTGIFKPKCLAFSVLQEPHAENILRNRAAEKGVSLTFVDVDPDLSDIDFATIIQRRNATLAVALTKGFLSQTIKKDHVLFPKEVLCGLKSAHLPGRCQLLRDGLYEWYLDGAHTEDSLAVAGQWYADTVTSHMSSLPHVLIFNHHSQRDGDALLRSLFQALRAAKISIQRAIFCTHKLSKQGAERGGILIVALAELDFAKFFTDFTNRNCDPAVVGSLRVQSHYSALWQSLDPDCHVAIAPTVEEAVDLARKTGKQGVQTLVTGSFHLVGSALFLLEPVGFD